jgi:hypothetical protein
MLQVGNFPDTVYGNATTETIMTSYTADHVLWARLTDPATTNANITFDEITSPQPIHAAIEYLNSTVAPQFYSTTSPNRAIIVAAGRARRLAVDSHQTELKELATSLKAPSAKELRKTVGDVPTAFLIATVHQVMVFQAHPSHGTA